MAARFSFGVNAEVASETFMRLGIRNTTRVPRITGRLFSTVGFGRAGSLSLLATRREYQNGELTDLVSLRHSLDLRGVGYLGLSAIRIAGTERDTIFGLSFSRSLGNRLHANSAVTSDSDGVAGYAQVQKGLPSDTGMGYRMRARAGVLQGVDGAVSYQGDYGTYSLEAEHHQSGTQARASASGGLALMSAGLFPSRRIDGSFAVARVGEEADVRVYRDNQLVGRTNEEGYILLPGLRAYEGNQISIEQADLPLDISVQALQVKAVPAYRSGVVLAFPVERSRGALLSVMLENGEPLPAGALVTVVGQPETYPVGVRGEVYIGRLADQNQLRATWHDGSCELDVAYTPSEDPLPHLGSFECRATP
jgi:outer membrane usher protein